MIRNFIRPDKGQHDTIFNASVEFARLKELANKRHSELSKLEITIASLNKPIECRYNNIGDSIAWKCSGLGYIPEDNTLLIVFGFAVGVDIVRYGTALINGEFISFPVEYVDGENRYIYESEQGDVSFTTLGLDKFYRAADDNFTTEQVKSCREQIQGIVEEMTKPRDQIN